MRTAPFGLAAAVLALACGGTASQPGGTGSGGVVKHTLAVGLSGSGVVTSSPAGIDCGATCSASFAQGATVSLSAAEASGFTFAGWSGGCSGQSACTLAMSADAAVTATLHCQSAASSRAVVHRDGGDGRLRIGDLHSRRT